MPKTIRNTTISDIDLKEVGERIAASTTVTVDPTKYIYYAKPEAITEITPYINSGDLVIGDGVIDLPALEAIDFLKYPDTAQSARFTVPSATQGDFGTLTPGGDVTVEEGIDNAAKVVRVSSGDTRYRHLEDKLEAGSAILITKVVDGVTGEETLRFSAQDAIDNDLDTLGFGRTGTVADTFLRSIDNLSSDASPEILPYDMVLRKLSFSNSRNNIGDVRVEVYSVTKVGNNRTLNLIYTEDFLNITGGWAYTPGEINVQLNLGEGLAVKVISLTNPRPADVKLLVWLRQGVTV